MIDDIDDELARIESELKLLRSGQAVDPITVIALARVVLELIQVLRRGAQ